MKDLVDLHTHSTASDGSMSPSRLVQHAFESGLKAIALTDHDTMEGIPEAMRKGDEIHFEVIPGVEISVDFTPEMHVLGYFAKEKYPNMEPTLKKLQEKRDERNPRIIRKLQQMGFDITMEEVEKETLGKIVGRVHIASVMVRKGYVKSVKEAFDNYLSYGKPAFFKKEKLSPEEGINAISMSGGIPVLAHPKYLSSKYDELDTLVSSLTKSGLRGIEVYYVDNTPEETHMFYHLAKKHNLIITGGTDFHGHFKPDITIGRGYGGLSLPYNILDRVKAYL